MLRLLRRKEGVLHQTKTSNLYDLLERILNKGMFIFGRQIFPAGRCQAGPESFGAGDTPRHEASVQQKQHKDKPGPPVLRKIIL